MIIIIIICFKTHKLHCSQFIINIHQPTTPTTTVSDAATLQTFTEFSALGHLQGHMFNYYYYCYYYYYFKTRKLHCSPEDPEDGPRPKIR